MNSYFVGIKNTEDDVEVYKCRPNPFMLYFIYILTLILVILIVWMSFSKMNTVIDCSGTFKGGEAVYEISSMVSGEMVKCNVRNGQLVERGDLLYVFNVNTLDEQIQYYYEQLQIIDSKITILEAYLKSLDGDKSELEKLRENTFYQEIVNKEKLLYTNISLNETDMNREEKVIQENKTILTDSIDKYEKKIINLDRVKKCIVSRINEFDDIEESYYSSIVNSYLSEYKYVLLQYDNQIKEYEDLLNEYKKIVANNEDESTVSQNEISENEIEEKIKNTGTKINLLKTEKQQALNKLELQQLSAIEQQIDGVNDTIASLQMNISLTQAEEKPKVSVKELYILEEKEKISNEILTLKTQRGECENNLEQCNIQNEECSIEATMSGYFYVQQDLKEGTYVYEGANLGLIYPEAENTFYVEAYVENKNIAKIKKGQVAKIEIAAYPASEYGYYSGEIINISKDTVENIKDGKSYYIVEIACDVNSNEKGEEINIVNGMMCQTKIIIGEESTIKYLLNKVGILE